MVTSYTAAEEGGMFIRRRLKVPALVKSPNENHSRKLITIVMSARNYGDRMGTAGYLPRGGACVSCRRRKMVNSIVVVNRDD